MYQKLVGYFVKKILDQPPSRPDEHAYRYIHVEVMSYIMYIII